MKLMMSWMKFSAKIKQTLYIKLFSRIFRLVNRIIGRKPKPVDVRTIEDATERYIAAQKLIDSLDFSPEEEKFNELIDAAIEELDRHERK